MRETCFCQFLELVLVCIDLFQTEVFLQSFKTVNVIRCQTTDNEIGYGYSIDEECFWVIKPFNKEPATRGNGSQLIITANSKEEVDLFYATALKAGGHDEGAPGLRDHTPNYYGAYIKDLDGNKIHIYKIL